MKNLKTLTVFILAILAISCSEDDSTPQNPEPDITGYDNIKNENWRDNIGREFEIEGILIESNGVAKLLLDANDYYIDAILDEKNYIYIDKVPELDNTLNFSEYFGKRVKITGTCQENDNDSIITSSILLGDISLATIVITQFTAFQVVNPNIIVSYPPIFSICDRYPQLCELQYSQDNKTALIYSGGINAGYAYGRYWNDVKFMYRILLDKGYPEDKIRVVYKNGIGEDSSIPVHYAANPTGLSNAFTYLQGRMDNSTKFFLMLNNHGGGNDSSPSYSNSGVVDNNNDEISSGTGDGFDEQYYYYDNENKLTDDFLAQKINSLPMGSMIGIIKPCYSGGVIWDFRGPNRVIMTSGTEFQVTYSHNSGQFGEFTYHFFAAVTGSDPLTGTAVNADLNADGYVSMYEAQVYILANDTRNEQPQYEDDNDGIGTSTPNSTGYGASVTL